MRQYNFLLISFSFLLSFSIFVIGCGNDDDSAADGGTDTTTETGTGPEGTGDLIWAVRAGGTESEDAFAICVDNDGSIFVTGEYDFSKEGSVFGQGEANETWLTSVGDLDIFLASYDVDGVLNWVTSAGGDSNDDGDAITILPGGEIVIGGTQYMATFGVGEPNETTFDNGETYYASYNPNGELNHVFTELGNSEALSATSTGGFMSTGAMTDKNVYGEGEPNETTLISAGGTDILVVRYEENGTLGWAVRAGSSDDDWGRDIASMPDGSVVVTGYIAGNAYFGDGDPNETTLYCEQDTEGFIAKYNENGELDWAKRFQGIGTAVAATESGEIYVTGGFSGEPVFGPGEENETTLVENVGQGDCFLAKFSNDGSLEWVLGIGGNGGDVGRAVGVLSDGSVVVSGTFDDNLELDDPPEGYSEIVSPAGERNLFLVRFTPSGDAIWVKGAFSDSTIWPYDLAIGPDDSIAVTGVFADDATFGYGEPNETVLTNAGSYDIFIAKFEP